MAPAPATMILMLVCISGFAVQAILAQYNFNKYYSYLWGSKKHFTVNPNGTQVDLLMDRSSGAGFRSKHDYRSGLFHIRMKIPEKTTAGVITNFYLTSAAYNETPGNHYEIDFEFLGTNGSLQTNVFNRDEGGRREQTFTLWFNPSQDFHTYEFLWNSHQIVFLVDKIPIRVFKNISGLDYLSIPMHIEASIWSGDWAGVVDWSQAPFIAQYQDFGFVACAAIKGRGGDCDSQRHRWNTPSYWKLGPLQQRKLEQYRKQFMTFDYCSHPQTWKPECQFNV